jgi:hypothetical protein
VDLIFIPSVYSSYYYVLLYMDTLRINIINPKAIQLLKDLADMDLISIQSNSENGFEDILKRLRAKSTSAPSLEEITKEVEAVRSARYAK